MIGKSVELALMESESASAVGAVKKISFTRRSSNLRPAKLLTTMSLSSSIAGCYEVMNGGDEMFRYRPRPPRHRNG
jgi:hypothetical protein